VTEYIIRGGRAGYDPATLIAEPRIFQVFSTRTELSAA
jgi:hypothetical protein